METLTQRAFAAAQGWTPAWVAKLKRDGRLVLVGDGRRKRVAVAESLARIAQTAGTRDDVARRHAEARQAGPDYRGKGDASPTPAGALLGELDAARHLKVTAEARRVAALADREEMERDRLAGALIAREDVDAAMRFLGAAVRAQMEVFADQVAPLVAPVADLDECHALLTEQCRQVLTAVAEALERQAAALAKDGDG